MKTILTILTLVAIQLSALASTPLIYAAKFSSGTGEDNSINVTVLQNDFGQEISWEKISEGVYRGTCLVAIFPTGRLAPFVYESSGGDIFAVVSENTENRVVVNQTDGRFGDNVSGPEIYFEIKVFPTE